MRFSIFLALFVLVLCGCGDAPPMDASATTAPVADFQTTYPQPTIDGYTYRTVKIGGQEWFAENLRTTVYANGDQIPYGGTNESWVYQEMGMRCSCDHDDAMNAKFGQLYNWYAVDDARGLCPAGWHVPSDEDWQDLEVFLGMSRADVSLEGRRGSGELGIGAKLKAKSGWEKAKSVLENDKIGENGTDDFGFSALPGCGRNSANGGFVNFGAWWSSSPDGGQAWQRNLLLDSPDIIRGSRNPPVGSFVRCLRDAD